MKLGIQHKTLFHSFLIILVLSSACFTRAQEFDDENEFSYDENSEKGPSHWGSLRPEWAICSTGKKQSPIAILKKTVEIAPDLGRLHRYYKNSAATLVNTGHDMTVRWDRAGFIQIKETMFELKQIHWHSPSEHTLDGRRFEMEAHLVHQSEDDRIAVIGILYEIGRPDSFLSLIEPDLHAMIHTGEIERSLGVVDPKVIEFGSSEYYRYVGSLTTPPCTEDVIWTIIAKVSTVTREQVNLMRKAVHDEVETNARPIQQLNKRTVKLYTPRHNEMK
ncbi:bifunctional monodehydroascorbate reductase and carbonic anhydrase nectarin-3-like [Primulina huaijiensis]|uniref:bifunctional monodehydroascorbate reductase and carbonic anhydrase nectarin-3-like n=1 Tax=Primulina huaijiensis TaxID=1492673 RepID=UPI003CC7994A